ncbi:MAG: Gfo/Idh/MocA family oxidoreductase [Pirellulales bacterium]|nr:Gfo/Idh/MocA family oxidoreductase [Pirellulales bacterium]
MNPTSRRGFFKRSAAASAAFAAANLRASPWLRAAGANDDIRLAVVGVGSRVKIGGMGRNEIRTFRRIPGVRIVALCDVDDANLQPEVESFQKQNEKVAAYADVRELLDSRDIDAVVVTTPNHWHALVTIWACQAGKDVYVQKPASYNIFEGRQMVDAAGKYRRIVQCPNGSRTPNGHAEALDYVRRGELGKILTVRHVHFSPRSSIGKASAPQPIPSTLDYNLWSGPAPIVPLARTNLHYDWHWQWLYGNGELGNWGIHHLDGCRMIVGGGLPRHVITIGGRFGYEDDGQTPNTLIVYFDYEPAPVVSEFRGLPKDKSFLANAVAGKDFWGADAMDSYQGIPIGKVIHCEHGYVISTINSHAAFDTRGRQIMTFEPTTPPLNDNFIQAVRSRRAGDLVSDMLQGHLSAVLVHLGNISYRIGKTMPDSEIRQRVEGDKELSAAYQRLQAHLCANGVDLDKTPATLGAMLTFDPDTERFVGEFSQAANQLISREYRPPFVVPEHV